MGIPGFGKVISERVVGPEEGIEDKGTIDSYEKLSRQLPFRIVRQIALRKLRHMKPHGHLADLGCGPGFFTLETARAVKDITITASDISPDMLERARKNLAYPDISPRIRFEQADIMALPFEANSFDFVTSTLSLHHWDDPEQGFREIQRVLKPGGQFMVYDTRRDSPGLYYRLLALAQRTILPLNLIEKNEPVSSVMASYTPEEAARFIENLPCTEKTVSGGVFWLFVTGRKM